MTKPCSECQCTGRHAKARIIAARSCTPATCWQWDHDCFAKRMRSGRRAATTLAPIAPATHRGSVVPNVTLTAAA